MESSSSSFLARATAGLTLYAKPRFLVVFLLGFSSGLPFLLTSSVLSYWFRKEGIPIATIGFLSLVAVPYSLKFLWAPLLDKTRLPWLSKKLGQRRAMALFIQLWLVVAIIALGFSDPVNHLQMAVSAATLVAFFSASQDMMIDAIRVEMVKDKEQAASAAVVSAGYRLAMLVAGGGVLILSDILFSDSNIPLDWVWPLVFFIVAGLQLWGMVAVLFCPKLGVVVTHQKRESFLARLGDYLTLSFWHPFKDFFLRQPKAITLLLFLVFYKYGDAFMGTMANPFYVDMGFSGVEIGSIVKTFGFVMTLLGGFFGGAIVFRRGFMTALWVGGIAQAAANIFFVILSMKGHDVRWLTATIAVDNFMGGLATAALVGFIGHLVNTKHSVTQLALLTSFSAIGRSMLSAPAGLIATGLGYPLFFGLSMVLALPGLWLLAQLHAAPNFIKLMRHP